MTAAWGAAAVVYVVYGREPTRRVNTRAEGAGSFPQVQVGARQGVRERLTWAHALAGDIHSLAVSRTWVVAGRGSSLVVRVRRLFSVFAQKKMDGVRRKRAIKCQSQTACTFYTAAQQV